VNNCTYQGLRSFNIPEEKKNDVNIAVHMIKDAIYDKCDRFIVVSGDSDLVPAVKAVKLITPRRFDNADYIAIEEGSWEHLQSRPEYQAKKKEDKISYLYDITHNSYRRIVVSDDTTYCFLLQDDPEPRERRKAHLGTICFIARGKYKKNKKVIGIATEKKMEPTCSYDFCLMYVPKWTNELQKQSEDIQNKNKIFLNPSIHHIREEEYPIQE